MFTTKEFHLTDEEYSKVKHWAKSHKCKCRSKSCCGGEISIIFTPTTIGIAKSAKCVCGEKLDLDTL